ncbi:UNKNOWN [Stylonychia lemnae]|uniref:Uncharacterized protein n=1 Tax=Stylonychia lemnae TaxID=5949 RepID=A0A077ZVM8_STYLE|nr:UNKNOWN [Stylonychia lemnae]|eukprot:CDW72491.1 UNKNOWN [Stylonychia lemnae]
MVISAVTANSTPVVRDWSPNGLNSTQMTFIMTAIRSTIQGFQRGLYNNGNFKISDQCLQSSFNDNMLKVEEAISSANYFNMIAAASPIYQVAYNLQKSCNLNELSWMLMSVCEKGTCNVNQISANIVKNLFFITGSMNTIVELYVDGLKIKLNNLEQCESNFNEMGSEVGRIVRLLFGFNKNKIIDRSNFY